VSYSRWARCRVRRDRERSRPGLDSYRGGLSKLRSREPGRGPVLRRVRRPARGRARARVSQDGDRPLLRRHRLDRARRADRPREPAQRDGPLLRDCEGGDRAARRHGREVHRGRRHGGLRRPGRPRGRCAPRRARRCRPAQRARPAERGSRAQVPDPPAATDRGQHGPGRHRDRGTARHRRRRQRRGSTRASGPARRDPARRGDAAARARRGRGGGGGPGRGKGQVRAACRLPAGRGRPPVRACARPSRARVDRHWCASGICWRRPSQTLR